MATTDFSAGTVVTSAWLNDADDVVYGISGATGNGVANDTAFVLAALQSGKLVDGRGRSYGVSGTVAPSSLKGLRNATLVQLAPGSANRTLDLQSLSDFSLENVKIDRGGSAGYTVGTIGSTATGATWAGININLCSKFQLRNVHVTNGGRGTGIAIWNSTDWDWVGCRVSEHYWQEVVPAAPVVTDDIIQPWWINNCSRFSMNGGGAVNCTSGAAGSPSTNVGGAATRVRNYTRCAWGGCSGFTLEGIVVDNVAQAYDFTGTVGNSQATISNCMSLNAGVSGFKFANSSYQIKVSNCLAYNPNQYGFLITGMTDVLNPLVRDIDFSDCMVINAGGLSNAYAGLVWAYSVEAKIDVDNTYPRSIVFNRCVVLDRQGSPTTNIGFRSNLAPIISPTAGYDKSITIRCVDCRVDVPGMSAGNQYSGIQHPYMTVVGGAGTDAVNSGTWTTLNLDGTKYSDPSGLHSVSSNADIIYIKEDGLYVIKGRTAFAANATGSRSLRITVNGGNVEDESLVAAHATGKTYIWDTWTRFLVTGDQVRLQGWQNSGGALNVTRSDTILALVKVA